MSFDDQSIKSKVFIATLFIAGELAFVGSGTWTISGKAHLSVLNGEQNGEKRNVLRRNLTFSMPSVRDR
jgi:hypothetical protein